MVVWNELNFNILQQILSESSDETSESLPFVVSNSEDKQKFDLILLNNS